jgi:hypothetical protein
MRKEFGDATIGFGKDESWMGLRFDPYPNSEPFNIKIRDEMNTDFEFTLTLFR